jgi:hypothetical protein
MLSQFQTLTTNLQLSLFSLALAFACPLVGMLLGGAIGKNPDQLGGIMITYWSFIALTAVSSGVGLAKGQAGGLPVFLISSGALATPLVLKAAFLRRFKWAESSQSSSQRSDGKTSDHCQPQLVAGSVRSLTGNRRGRDGVIGWFFWIGNRYTWDLQVDVRANDQGASATATASGEVSAWYSVVPTHRYASASANGYVQCESTPEKSCLAFGAGDRQGDTDADFRVVAEVRVSGGGAAGPVTLDGEGSAAVSGTPGIATVGVGGKVVGVGVKGSLQSPNGAKAELSRSGSYMYRCARSSGTKSS